MNYSVAERSLIVDGVRYGTLGLYDFVYENTHWAIFGWGHQYNEQEIAPMAILLATYGNAGSSWQLEGYPKSDGRGNWIKFGGQNSSKPVRYVV